jgi:hypothetical protein
LNERLKMSDYEDLCESYGIYPGDPDGFNKILSIWAEDEKQQYRYSGSKRISASKISKGKWIPAPLNIKNGDIEKWKADMKERCPSPKVGEVVIFEDDGKIKIGYECTSLDYDEPSWRRVMCICQENFDDNEFEDCPF